MNNTFIKDLKIPFFTILFIFVGFFLYTKLFGPIPFYINSIQTNKSNLFYVQGVGEATAIPDTAQFSVGVTKNAQNVLDAQNQVNTVIKNIQKDLKALGIEEKNIKTTSYSVNPNYEFSGGKQTTNGYTVNANLDIKVTSVDTANKAIDAATADGANIIGGITFVLNDATKKQLQQKAREDAVKDAKEKAENLTKAAGISLGRIIDIQEINQEPFDQPRYAMASEANKDTVEQPTSLTPGESTVKVTISLSYETR